MKIGIWCDYEQTLGPTEGIGVFIDSLSRGIIEADKTCTILLKCNPKDFEVMDSLVEFGRGRISIECGVNPRYLPRKLSRVLSKIESALATSHERNSTRLLGFALNIFRKARYSTERFMLANQRSTIEKCDLWLVPYVGLHMHFTRPYIVVVHDLVCCHFPELMRPKQLARFMSNARDLVNKSNRVACMSEYISKTDIKGILNVPDAKIKVLRSAVPHDVIAMKDHETNKTSLSHYTFTDRDFILYPAAFRSYKNHLILLDALRKLNLNGETNWHLVFTGLTDCPEDISAFIADNDLANQVTILGKVDRKELANLYRHAFATIVPSRYEQGSFPVLEAIALGCPAVASDIPSLREQFANFGDAMLFAHPDSSDEVIDCLKEIRSKRETIIRNQSIAFNAMTKFTWRESARSWLDLFSEAANQT